MCIHQNVTKKGKLKNVNLTSVLSKDSVWLLLQLFNRNSTIWNTLV